MLVKEASAHVKAAGETDGLEAGQVKALVSVFDVVDSYGDVIRKGAFAKSLADWEQSGNVLPFIWAHDWGDPYSHIGVVEKAEETDEGLVVQAKLDLDNPKAEQVYRLMKGRRVTQFSFAYDVVDGSEQKSDGRDVYELRELKLHEVGPCLIGVNQSTDLLSVKARELEAGLKAGRVLSQKNFENLVTARDALDQVIKAASPEEEEEKAAAVEADSHIEVHADDETAGKSSKPGPMTRMALANQTIINL